MHSMPVSDLQIVGSRYLSCILFAAVSVLGSLLAAIPVSVASDAFTFKGLVGPIVFFCSVLLIYMSIVMFCIYLIGSEKADLIQCIPFIVLLVAGEGYLAAKLSSVAEPAFHSSRMPSALVRAAAQSSSVGSSAAGVIRICRTASFSL